MNDPYAVPHGRFRKAMPSNSFSLNSVLVRQRAKPPALTPAGSARRPKALKRRSVGPRARSPADAQFSEGSRPSAPPRTRGARPLAGPGGGAGGHHRQIPRQCGAGAAVVPVPFWAEAIFQKRGQRGGRSGQPGTQAPGLNRGTRRAKRTDAVKTAGCRARPSQGRA